MAVSALNECAMLPPLTLEGEDVHWESEHLGIGLKATHRWSSATHRSGNAVQVTHHPDQHAKQLSYFSHSLLPLPEKVSYVKDVINNDN